MYTDAFLCFGVRKSAKFGHKGHFLVVTQYTNYQFYGKIS